MIFLIYIKDFLIQLYIYFISISNQDKIMTLNQLLVCEKLAKDLGIMGKYSESLKAAQKGLSISLQLFGNEHIQTANFYGLVAAGLMQMQNYQQSLQMNSKALRIQEKQEPPNYIRICTTKDCIARTHRQNKNYQQSMHMYQQLVQFQKTHLKEKQREQLALTLVNFAGLFFALNQIEKAFELYEQAITESEKIFGKNNHISLVAKQNIMRLKKENQMIPSMNMGAALQLLRKRKDKSQTVTFN